MLLPVLLWTVAIARVISEDAAICDKDTEFDCGFGPHRCIPLEWICDNMPDCLGGQDEGHCNYLHACPVGSLICRDGTCISSTFKCDGNADCPGGSDEAGCAHAEALNITLSHPHSLRHEDPRKLSWLDLLDEMMDKKCEKRHFKCADGGPCIVAEAVCDGLWDCPNGDDETNCSSSNRIENVVDHDQDVVGCPLRMTSCADRSACIPTSWVCDGEGDCDDHSDEFDCDEERSLAMEVQSNHHLCGYNEYRCSDAAGLCIPYNRTCDHVSDCPHGDDEGAVCDECNRLHCSWRCHISSSGSVCTCPEGSRLSPDGYTCTEVNECETDGRRCQHYCEDRSNRYECHCAPGYYLHTDGYSCRVTGAKEGSLFVSLGSEVRTLPLSEGAPTSSYDVAQHIENHGHVRSVAYMNSNKHLYMTISGLAHEGELAYSSEGSLSVLRENIPGIGQIAVDWIGGNVFFTQKAPAANPGISICDAGGFYCRQIVQGEISNDLDASRHQTYRGLALNPQHGKIFWIEGYNNVHRIKMANMDGTNVETVVDSKLDYPSGLAIDHIRGDLYFGDVEKEMIESVNIHSRERTVILTSGVHHPHDLAYFNGFLYWSDWGTESLKVAEITHHHSSSHVIHSFNRFPYGISINHPLYQQQPNKDPCKTINCPWICVAVPGSDNKLHPKCVCPENYSPDEDSCVPHIDRQDVNVSHISVSLMQQLCAQKNACSKHGECKNLINEHERVDRIICVCQDGFEGDHCELSKQFTSAASEEGSSSSAWTVIFICIFFLATAAAVFYVIFANVDAVGSSFDRWFALVDEKTRDNFPDSDTLEKIKERVKRHIPNLPTLSPRSRSELPSDVTNTFNNPLFANGAVSEYDQPTGAAALEADSKGSYSNTSYSSVASESVSGGPFSDYEVCYSKKVVH